MVDMLGGGGDCKRLGGKLKMAILIVKLYI